MQPSAPGSGSKGSLADYKERRTKLQSAAAGEVLAKVPAKQPRPIDGQPAAKKARQAFTSKPWWEKTAEEKQATPVPKNVPLTKQIRDVLSYLEVNQTRGFISWTEVVQQAIPPWYMTDETDELHQALLKNPRAKHDPVQGFQYHSEHGIKDKVTLLAYIKSQPDGVRSNEIKDGYERVLEDAAELHADKKVYKFYNAEFKVDVFFAVPSSIPGAQLPEDFVDMYLRTQAPADVEELKSDLRKIGVRSRLAAVERKQRVTQVKQEKKKKQRKMNLKNMTNVHLAEQLKDSSQFTSIDRA